MAEARLAKRHVHVHEMKALSYGHLGTASYDPLTREWSFLRRNPRQLHFTKGEKYADQHIWSSFELVKESTRNVSTTASNDQSQSEQQVRSGTGLQNLFLKSIPDAAVVLGDLPSSSYSSNLRPDTSAPVQPSSGILALGNARPLPKSGTRSNPVLASPVGPGKETLRLLSFDTCDVEIPNDSGSQDLCTVAGITKRNIGYWRNSADAIIHVSSANTTRGTLFLVVKRSGTTILRCQSDDDSHNLSSRRRDWTLTNTSILTSFDPLPVVTIPFTRTGGQSQVHAAFNPRDQRLVAIVDTRGQWSIWEVTGTRAKSARISYRVHLKGSSRLPKTEKRLTFPKAAMLGRGWHRLCWVKSDDGSADHILVCNRRNAAIFDQSGMFANHLDMRLGPPSDRNLILDIRNGNRQQRHIFVLTTSRLMVFGPTKADSKERDQGQMLQLVCSWNTFRDRKDITLRMTILESMKDSWMLIYSLANHFATMYRFGEERSGSDLVSLQEPSIFELPQQLKSQGGGVSDIILCPLNFSIKAGYSREDDYSLVKLVAYTTGGTIVEAVYKSALPPVVFTEELPDGAPFLLIPRNSELNPKSFKYIHEEDDLNYFINDDDERDIFVEGKAAANNVSSVALTRPLGFRNWEHLLDLVGSHGEQSTSLTFQASLENAVEQFRHLYDGNNATSAQLLSDLVGSCRIADVEEDSQSMEEWIHNLSLHSDIGVELAVYPDGELSNSDYQLLRYYNHLLDIYVRSLSDGLTDRNRVNRERLVRHVLGPIVFGALLLRSTKPNTLPTPLASNAAHFSDTTFPPSSSPMDSDARGRSETPGTASPGEEEPAVARLRQYATFKQRVPPLSLNHDTRISAILGHLPDSIEEDPADYSYHSTNQKLKLAQDELAVEALAPKERRKVLKSVARLQRKLERTQQISQEAIVQRTVVPSINVRTTLPAREIQSSQGGVPASSQDTPMPGISMTQPERGAFGGRQSEKKVKKKRLAGF